MQPEVTAKHTKDTKFGPYVRKPTVFSFIKWCVDSRQGMALSIVRTFVYLVCFAGDSFRKLTTGAVKTSAGRWSYPF
jgi:hypothetical protein